MMRRLFFHPAAAVLVIMSSLPALADLEEVKKETNLQRRSRLALENADKALDGAREAYRKGDGEGLDQSLAEVKASVELDMSRWWSRAGIREEMRSPISVGRSVRGNCFGG